MFFLGARKFFETHSGVGFLDGVHHYVKAHPLQSLCSSENATNVTHPFPIGLACYLLLNP